MHFDDGKIPVEYTKHIFLKKISILVLFSLLIISIFLSIYIGAANLSLKEIAISLMGGETTPRIHSIIWNIRLPQASAAIVAGGALAITGVVMQSVLRNPLASSFTLGISQGAAFGAALSIALGGGMLTSGISSSLVLNNPWVTTASAFIFSLLCSFVIILVAKKRGSTPEMMVLTGVALGSLFTAGTMFLQYMANDVQLGAMVFWTFGDTSRATWRNIGIMTVATLIVFAYFYWNAWNYNAMGAGDEYARSLGIKVNRVRVSGMVLASALTATVISVLGIIGFVGLVVPHIMRRTIGPDNRYLLPATLIGGALLVLVADIASRNILKPLALPVSVLMSFLGAPVLLWLILGKRSM